MLIKDLKAKRINSQKNRVFNPLTKIVSMALIALVFLFLSWGKAQTFKADTGYAEVQGGNGMTTYIGKSDQLQGTINLNESSVQFSLPLKSLETGNGLRDNHMRSTLETEKYPNTKFSGQIVSDFPEKGRSKMVKVKGNYTIHGITKPIEVKGVVKRKEEKIQVKATFPIEITEYGMERPGFWFAEVNDKHSISIRVTLMRQNS